MNKRRSRTIEAVLDRLDECIKYHEGKKGFNSYYAAQPRPLHNILWDVFSFTVRDFYNISSKGSRAITKHYLGWRNEPFSNLHKNIISDVEIDMDNALILYKKTKKDYIKEDIFLEMLDIIRSFGGNRSGVCKYFIWGSNTKLNVKLYEKERQWIESKGFKFISDVNLKIVNPNSNSAFFSVLISGWVFEIPTLSKIECIKIINAIKLNRKQELI